MTDIKIKALSDDNKLILLIAEQIAVLKETDNYEMLLNRLNMLSLKHI